MKRLFTSESVTEGHPDKVCDKISDAVLDAVLEQDPNGRVACEAFATTGLILLGGEITADAAVDYQGIARNALREIGYDSDEAGFNADSCAVITAIDKQSPDIALGTNDKVGGAGDQGMMFGYACNETLDFMPLPITLAHRMAYRLAKLRKCNDLPWALPDGKTQVTIEYSDNVPVAVDTVVVSTQHTDDLSIETIRNETYANVIYPCLVDLRAERPINTRDVKVFINPTGRFVKGGPAADTGLTGRKIIVDTYGGYAAHGGGAFSGKDPTKVDRSAAYAARHVAKNLVAAGLADRCQVQIAYAIGVAKPVSVNVDTFGTGKKSDEILCELVKDVFDLTPQGIIKRFDLRRPIYRATAAYGHFGNVIGDDRPWERLDFIDALR